MTPLVWNGLPRLPWTKRPDAVEGLVLSGGGSKASFQIEALRYLYERAEISPSTIVATSGGSILGAMLAQFAEPEQQSAAVRRLEQLWYEMDEQADMFTERPWFSRLRSRSNEWISLMNREAARPSPTWSLPRINVPFRSRDHDEPPPEDEQTADPEQLSGQAKTLQIAMSDQAPSGSAWTPQLAMNLMSLLPRLRGAGSDLSLILRGADASRSMYHPGPLLAKLLDPETFRAELVARSGIVARFAMVGLESGELRFMRQDGRIVDRDDHLIDGTVHDVSRGILASCSIPAVFPPVEMDQEWYVDGGVRENVPAEMAIGHLGVSKCYVVSCATVGVERAEGFDAKSMLSVVMRSTEIMSDETGRDEIAYARNAGAMVIEPELRVHDALTVDPGLIRINRDYGWLRAAEEHLDAGHLERSLHREIISLRMRAHALELSVIDGSADDETLAALAEIKHALHDQIGRVRPDLLPADHERWWSQFEAHSGVDLRDLTPTWA